MPDPAAAERAEQLLRNAMVVKRRGETEVFRKLLDEAVEIAPGSPSVILAKGEELLERRKAKEAAEWLKKGFELHPTQKQIESLYGEAVLRQSGMADLVAKGDFESVAEGRTATLLATFVPGAGHLVLGLWGLAALYFTLCALGLVWAFSVPNGMTGLMALVGLNRSGTSDLNPQVLVALFLTSITWLVNVSDVHSRTKRVAKKVVVDRPTPPVDKPFEL